MNNSRQIYNRQKTSHQDSFCMSMSKHRNGLASTIDLNCNRKKRDKHLSNHRFPLHLHQQTKHHSGETHFAALKWYSINFQWVFGMQIIGGGGGQQRSWKFWIYLGRDSGETFTKIEAYAGMAERLVRDLAIEEALWDEIKFTLEHKN